MRIKQINRYKLDPASPDQVLEPPRVFVGSSIATMAPIPTLNIDEDHIGIDLVDEYVEIWFEEQPLVVAASGEQRSALKKGTDDHTNHSS